MSHLKGSHTENYITEYYALARKPRTLDSFVRVTVDASASNMYHWLDWILMEHLPLAFCTKKRTRMYSTLDDISVDTLCKYMDSLEDIVVDNIRGELKNKRVGLLYDAWTEGETHYVAIIAAVQASEDAPVADKYLLCFTPFEDEKSMDADAFVELFDYVLDHYRIDAANLCFITCDHAKVNGALSRKARVSMLGCASHRFQLAVNLILKPFDEVLTKVNDLMGRLGSIKNRAKLREAGAAAPVQRNATRWASSFEMVKTFFAIHDKIDLSDSSLVDVIPTAREVLQLKKVLEMMKKLESISKRLQANDSDEAKKATGQAVALDGVRKLFDGVVKLYPATAAYLAPQASIVQSPGFEAAVVKVLSGKEGKLTAAEKRVLVRFERAYQSEETAEEEKEESFADMLLKATTMTRSRYCNLQWVPVTSNDVERLFSKAGLVYTSHRRRMEPTRLETIIFLEYNRLLWDAPTVAAAIQRSRKKQRTG